MGKKTFALPRFLKRLGVVLVLAGGFFLLAEASLRWGANYYFRQRARIPVRIGRLFINPATGQMTLGLKGSEPGQMLLLNLGSARFDWWTIVLRRLRVGNVHLSDIELAVRRDATGRVYVGDINVPTGQTEAPAKAPPHHGKPWGVGVGDVDLDNIRVLYQAPGQKLDLRVVRFHLDPTESWHPFRSSHFEGEFVINGKRLAVTGVIRPFAKTMGLDTDLSFVDDSMKPPFRYAIAPLSVRLENPSADKPDDPVRFTLLARMGRFEKIALSGSVSPKAEKPEGHLDLEVDDLNLTPFTSFSQRYAGYRLSSGLLDVKTKADVKHGLLEAQTSLTANKFYLEKLKKEELDTADQQIGLPLTLCLGLLRDADDNIRLRVPVEGDLTDPKVRIGKIIWQVLGKALAAAMRNAALSFFPSGTHIGFEPVVFMPASSQLTPEGVAYLNKVGEKLIQRPQVAIRLTGEATDADIKNLRTKNTDRLLSLAGARAEAVRTELIEQMKVDVRRVLVSPPAVDAAVGAPPRVELSL